MPTKNFSCITRGRMQYIWRFLTTWSKYSSFLSLSNQLLLFSSLPHVQTALMELQIMLTVVPSNPSFYSSAYLSFCLFFSSVLLFFLSFNLFLFIFFYFVFFFVFVSSFYFFFFVYFLFLILFLSFC